MALAILYRQELKEYDFGPGHPFRGDRYQVFPQFLQENLPEDDNYRIIKAEGATDEDLLLICQKTYIDFTKEYYRAASVGLSYPGQFSQFHSMDNRPVGKPGKLEEAARLIIGQAKTACELVQGGKFKKVVSIGGGMHHAHSAYGEGFCIYNDVAFCGLYLMQEYKLERILILDTDAHAGNGTSEYFYEEPRVLFVDLHQDPRGLYPGTGFAHQTGSGRGKGFTINIPMPVYADYDSYWLAFESIVEPVTQEFKPQIIIRNGGSDPHFADGLTNLGLPVKGFRMIGEKVGEIAKVCDGKVIDLIASGYNEKVLPYAWLALITGLEGIELSVEEPEPIPQRLGMDSSFAETERAVEVVRSQLKDYWACLR
ncbi:histone deacetylase family protein [Chloroflexota bacterium]